MAFRRGDPGYVEDRDAIVAAMMQQLFGIGGGVPTGGQSYPYNLWGGNGSPGVALDAIANPTANDIVASGFQAQGNPAQADIAAAANAGRSTAAPGPFNSANLNNDFGPPTGFFSPATYSPGRSIGDPTSTPVTTTTIAPGYPATTEQFGPPAPPPSLSITVTPAQQQAQQAQPGYSPGESGPTGAPGLGDVSGGYSTGYGSTAVGYGGDIAGGPGTGFGTGTGPGFGGFGDPGGFAATGLSGPGFDSSGGFGTSEAGPAGFDSGPGSVASGYDSGPGGSGESGAGGGGGGGAGK